MKALDDTIGRKDSALPAEVASDPHRHQQPLSLRLSLLWRSLEELYPRVMSEGTFKQLGHDVWGGKYGPIEHEDFLRSLQRLAAGASNLFPQDRTIRMHRVAYIAAIAYCNLARNADLDAYSYTQDASEGVDAGDDRERIKSSYEHAANKQERALYLAMDSARWEGMLMGLLHTAGETAASMIEKMVREEKSRAARNAAMAKLKDDPKQAEKKRVEECWLLWQADPGRYFGPTAFASDMLEKYTKLKSVAVIVGWCRDWKNGKGLSQRAD